MCHERWVRYQEERAAREEGRRVWDLFDRDVKSEPPGPVTAEERVPEAPERKTPDEEPAGAPR